MRIHLLDPDWLMVSNTLLVEEDLIWKAPAHDFVYRNRRGLIVMCANCRSSQRRDDPSQWDFCSAHVSVHPASLGVHAGLCPHLSRLFLSAHSIRVARDRELNIQEEYSDRHEVRRSLFGFTKLFRFDRDIAYSVLEWPLGQVVRPATRPGLPGELTCSGSTNVALCWWPAQTGSDGFASAVVGTSHSSGEPKSKHALLEAPRHNSMPTTARNMLSRIGRVRATPTCRVNEAWRARPRPERL